MPQEFVSGFTGDGSAELLQFMFFSLVMLVMVIGWCCWYNRGCE
tara:strand:+ start:508 stop:639 length:132 start_codon:yes stop_codon:yes gene_type:complete